MSPRPLIAETRKLPDASGSVPAPPTRPTVKSPITGIVPRTCNSTQMPTSRMADVGGIVVNCNHSDIQLTNGGAVDLTGSSEWNYYVGTLRVADPTFPAKLRVHFGDNAAAWLKNLGGGPLTVYSTSDAYLTNPHTVPIWWNAAVIAAWEDFATKLAAIVEGLSYIREIAMHFATTIFAEQCQRGTGQGNAGSATNGAHNRQTFITAGLTGCTYTGVIPTEVITGPDPTDAAALLYITQARWKTTYGFTTTPLYFPWNPFQQWESAGGVDKGSVIDPISWTEAVGIPAISSDMTSLGCIGNNSGRVPFYSIGEPYPATFQAVFDATALGSHQRIGLQTATLDRLHTDFGTPITGSGSTYNYTPPADITYHNAFYTTLRVLFGNITPANQGAQNYYSGITTAGNARYVELPNTWRGTSGSGFTTYADGSPALSSAECALLNGYAALNPTG